MVKKNIDIDNFFSFPWIFLWFFAIFFLPPYLSFIYSLPERIASFSQDKKALSKCIQERQSSPSKTQISQKEIYHICSLYLEQKKKESWAEVEGNDPHCSDNLQKKS